MLLCMTAVTVYDCSYNVYVAEIIISKGGLMHTYVTQM